MSSSKVVPHAATPDAAASLAALLCPARAEASRKNGAKSRGPTTAEGKARSARNALKHGLRAERYVVLPDEDEAAFKALEAALMADLAPQGALQAMLARRVVAATWRLERAERIECELFERHSVPILGQNGLGLAVIRDGHGTRAFDTLLRYRGAALAELWRALRTLKALQAEAAQAQVEPKEPEPRTNLGIPAKRPVAAQAAGDRPQLEAPQGRSCAALPPAAATVQPPKEPEIGGKPGRNAGNARCGEGCGRALRGAADPCVRTSCGATLTGNQRGSGRTC